MVDHEGEIDTDRYTDHEGISASVETSMAPYWEINVLSIVPKNQWSVLCNTSQSVAGW